MNEKKVGRKKIYQGKYIIGQLHPKGNGTVS